MLCYTSLGLQITLFLQFPSGFFLKKKNPPHSFPPHWSCYIKGDGSVRVQSFLQRGNELSCHSTCFSLKQSSVRVCACVCVSTCINQWACMFSVVTDHQIWDCLPLRTYIVPVQTKSSAANHSQKKLSVFRCSVTGLMKVCQNGEGGIWLASSVRHVLVPATGQRTILWEHFVLLPASFSLTPLFVQSPADSSCLQTERQNESSREITSFSTECWKNTVLSL